MEGRVTCVREAGGYVPGLRQRYLLGRAICLLWYTVLLSLRLFQPGWYTVPGYDCDSSSALVLFAGVSDVSPQYRNCVWKLSTNQDHSVV